MNRYVFRPTLWDDLLAVPGHAWRPVPATPTGPEPIRLDLHESDHAYTVVAELPGVAKEDIEVDIEGGRVTLRAERKPHATLEAGERLLRGERRYGPVARSMQLPVDIDDTEAHARYEHGVLTLSLPKRRAPAGQRRVRID